MNHNSVSSRIHLENCSVAPYGTLAMRTDAYRQAAAYLRSTGMNCAVSHVTTWQESVAAIRYGKFLINMPALEPSPITLILNWKLLAK